MLNVVAGPFHPELEQALADEIRHHKASDPLAPLTVVVPSHPLRTRLKWLLCREQGCSLLNVHLLTFFQLALRLGREQDRDASGEIRPDFFFKELVHRLLAQHARIMPTWEGLVDMPGGWAAVWATLKDMKDAKVNVTDAQEAWSQGEGGVDPAIQRVLSLYDRFQTERERCGAYDPDDLAVSVLDSAVTSPFLSRQVRILYYGFYDLTQVQLDLFQQIVRIFPSTLYFPLIAGHPAFAFAERFFNRYIQGMSSTPVRWVSSRSSVSCLRGLFSAPSDTHISGDLDSSVDKDGPPDSGSNSDQSKKEVEHWGRSPACHMVQVSGIEDEVTFVAKRILELVEQRDIPFHTIGVVGRTLSGYETVIPRVFSQHALPYTTMMNRSLAVFPLVKTAMHLLEVRQHGYPRDLVLEVLRSPVFRLERVCPKEPLPRPDLWDLASQHLGIRKGVHEWERVKMLVEGGLTPEQAWEEGGPGLNIEATQLRGMWSAVSGLMRGMDTIPERSSWGHYVDLTEDLWDRWLCMSEEGLQGDRNPPRRKGSYGFEDGALTDSPVGKVLVERLEELRDLERLDSEVGFPGFVGAVRRRMEEAGIPIHPDGHGVGEGSAVQVMDAMSARGLPFRVLFIVGLTEKVFPRHIQEDGFLRDRARRFLEVHLGFKIPEKLAGYDEEKLLFYLVANSATEFLTLLWQRSDQRGRSQVPSGYLNEVQALMNGTSDVVVPRRPTEKFTRLPQYRPNYLTPQEIGVRQMCGRQVGGTFFEEAHPCGALILRGLGTIRELEKKSSRLGAYDGITGPLDSFWQQLTGRGVSPTALERYATCPFQYFADRVLGLKPLTLPETDQPVDKAELGTLAHRILKACYHTLLDQGYFSDSADTEVDPQRILKEVAAPEFQSFAKWHSVGHSLVWELQQEHLLSTLQSMVAQDLAHMGKMWVPLLFETPMEGTVTVTLPSGKKTVVVKGRLDRVDWGPSSHTYRIIDYKYTERARPRPVDKNLSLGAIRGSRLQPPLYLIMAHTSLSAMITGQPEAGSERKEPVCDGVWLYFIAPNWPSEDGPLTQVSFPSDAWESSLGDPLNQAMSVILGGIQAGEFFIAPGDYCHWCEYRTLCRKTHEVSAWRARADHTRIRSHRQLRRATIPSHQGRKRTQKGNPDT